MQYILLIYLILTTSNLPTGKVEFASVRVQYFYWTSHRLLLMPFLELPKLHNNWERYKVIVTNHPTRVNIHNLLVGS